MDYPNGDHQTATLPAENTRRPRNSAGPSYIRSTLSNPRVRALVAGYLEQQVSILLSNGADTDNAEAFIAAQLDEVIDELRAQA
jgi:hypothetical protein